MCNEIQQWAYRFPNSITVARYQVLEIPTFFATRAFLSASSPKSEASAYAFLSAGGPKSEASEYPFLAALNLRPQDLHFSQQFWS